MILNTTFRPGGEEKEAKLFQKERGKSLKKKNTKIIVFIYTKTKSEERTRANTTTQHAATDPCLHFCQGWCFDHHH